MQPRFYVEIPNGLPLVHDIRGFASSKWVLEDQACRTKVEEIVSVMLTPDYQNLKDGYGYLKHGNSYYSIGWSVHLPNFLSTPSPTEMSKLILSLEMMASFEINR